MAYTLEDWSKRNQTRIDMTQYVTHLTKSANINGKRHHAYEVLVKILNDQKITASTSQTGYIVGSQSATCFQEAPFYGLSQNVVHEEAIRAKNDGTGRVRYSVCGLAFPKKYVYDKGGRPVIYEKSTVAINFIDKSQHWRIVSFDLSDPNNIVDWTHEREWRVPGDFSFDLSLATVILQNERNYRSFVKAAGPHILENISGIVTMKQVLS